MRLKYIALVSCYIIILSISLLIAYIYSNREVKYQIVEKGEYSRIQYTTLNHTMTPEFITGYYYVIRNYQTGKETKVELSQEEYETCVIGDTVE